MAVSESLPGPVGVAEPGHCSLSIANGDLARAMELHRAGHLDAAIAAYRSALNHPATQREARRNLCIAYLEAGNTTLALRSLSDELAAGHDADAWLNRVTVQAMTRRDLSPAQHLAKAIAAYESGSQWFDAGLRATRGRPQPVDLSRTKLRHDAGQLRHLLELHRAPHLPLRSWIALLEDAADELTARAVGEDERIPLDPESPLHAIYGRILHHWDAPRVRKALGDGWERDEVERLYREVAPGIVVVDGFLSPDALVGLRRFCLESTVFRRNRYGHGRLSGLFFDGFACPLVTQIAEELRADLGGLLGDRHPLRQAWAFKNTRPMPADVTIHADFAAVNVNFWITPDEANRDPGRGGLVIYGVDAPPHWTFEDYNGRLGQIQAFLRKHRPGHMRIPYKANRAVIFNSDLFHATDVVDFEPGYANHRVNVTMLFGDRAQDGHHPPRRSQADTASAWRSMALGRRRFR